MIADMPDPSAISSKEQAETDLIRAQIAKLEREGHPPAFGLRLLELIKLGGSLILGAGGVIAAITGYQMSEVKKERVELEFAQKQSELNTLNAQYQQRKADYDKLGADLKALSNELDERAKVAADATAKVERTHSQLLALRAEVEQSGRLSDATTRKLQGAIDDADSAKAATQKRDADLAKTKAEVQRLSLRQVELSRVTDQLNQRAQRATQPAAAE